MKKKTMSLLILGLALLSGCLFLIMFVYVFDLFFWIVLIMLIGILSFDWIIGIE